jgi:hypothetical protein
MTYHEVCNKCNTTGATSGAETTYLSGAHEITLTLMGFVLLCWSYSCETVQQYIISHLRSRDLSRGKTTLYKLSKTRSLLKQVILADGGDESTMPIMLGRGAFPLRPPSQNSPHSDEDTSNNIQPYQFQKNFPAPLLVNNDRSLTWIVLRCSTCLILLLSKNY